MWSSGHDFLLILLILLIIEHPIKICLQWDIRTETVSLSILLVYDMMAVISGWISCREDCERFLSILVKGGWYNLVGKFSMWLDRRWRKYEQVWASYLYACDINTIREDLNSLSMGSESMVDYAGGSNFKGRIYIFPRISIVEYQKKGLPFWFN